ncbi:VCBS repeat-containing protein, partial [Lacticaseibacillus rhamnosus]
VDAQAGVAAPGISPIIPERIDALPGMELADRVGPALCDKLAIGLAHFGPKQRVVGPTLGLINVEIRGHHVAIADVNGDGKPDVIVANSVTGSVSVLLGNGDGTLQAPFTSPIPNGGDYGVSGAVADGNGDGKPDLVTAGNSEGNVGVLLGNGDGTFQGGRGFGVGGRGFSSVAAADLNGDGKFDLV